MPTRDAYAVGALAALLFLVAFNLQAGWVYAVDALLAGILLAGALSAYLDARRVTVGRTLPAEAQEGETVRVALTLRARGRFPLLPVELVDAVPGLAPGRVIVPVLRPGQDVRTAYVTTAVRRGIHRVHGLTVRSGGLTGLFEAQRDVPAAAEIAVLPRFWRLRRFPPAAGASALQAAGTVRRGGGLEFSRLRDYRPGDSIRHVHWRSSARRGALVVREFEQEIPGSVVLLVDTRPAVHTGGDRDNTFEDLIRAAASVGWYVTSRGGRLRLLVSTASGPLDLAGGWTSLLRALAGLRLDGVETPAAVLAAAPGRSRTVVAFSPDAEALAALAASGAETVGVLADAASYAGGDGRGGATLMPTSTGLSRGGIVGMGTRPAGDGIAATRIEPSSHGIIETEAGPRDSVVGTGPGLLNEGVVGTGALCIIRKGDDIGARLEAGGP